MQWLTTDSDYWGDYSGETVSAAEVLVELNLEQYRPLLLAALTEFEKSEIERFVPAMVSWAVRGLAAGTLGAGSAEAAFCDAARDVRSGNVKTVEDILAKTRVGTLIPTDAAFEGSFGEWRVMRGPLARYLLRALELQQRGDSQPELLVNDDADSVNLEHILPKSARKEDWSAFTEDDMRSYVHRLGNMCLMQKGPNGRIGNKPWIVKQPILAESHIHLTSSASDAHNWNKSAIDRRQKRLAQLAVAAWPRQPRT